MSYFKPYVDETGPHIPTYEDRLEQLISDYRSIFGQDLYLGEDTMDYQMLSLFAKALDDLSSLVLASFSAMDPNYASGQCLDLLTPLYGLTRLPDETDAALRLRMSLALLEHSTGTLPAMENALRQVPNLRDVKIRVNDTNKADASGQPAHSIQVITKGGGTAAVAQAILDHKPAGVPTYGGVSTMIPGPFGENCLISFSRSKDLVTQFTLSIQPLEGYDPAKTEPLLKQAIADYVSTLRIGSPLLLPVLTASLARLEDPDHPTFAPVYVAASTKGGSSTVRVVPADDEIIVTDPALISVNVL